MKLYQKVSNALLSYDSRAIRGSLQGYQRVFKIKNIIEKEDGKEEMCKSGKVEQLKSGT